MTKPQEAFSYNSRQVQELKKLVAGGEGPSLEFKRKANSRTIIRYQIPESPGKPHYTTGNGAEKESFVRVNDQSIKASREVREIVKRARKKKDVRFHYGEHEKFLMQYLDVNLLSP